MTFFIFYVVGDFQTENLFLSPSNLHENGVILRINSVTLLGLGEVSIGATFQAAELYRSNPSGLRERVSFTMFEEVTSTKPRSLTRRGGYASSVGFVQHPIDL